MADSKAKNRASRRGPQARGERTRQRILEAALRVIARRGLGAMTIRDVAAEADVSLGVTTYHFPTRSELLTAAFALHLEEADSQGVSLTDAHAGAWRTGAMSLDQVTEAVVAMLSRMVHEDRDVFIAGQELTLEITRDPALARTVKSALSAHKGVIEQMMAAIGSPEPALDAEILSAAFEGLGLAWLAHPNDPEFDARLRRVVRRLLSKFLVA